MLDKYIVMDIENPNTRGNSICAIGIVIIENNNIKDKKYTLINPEDRFDTINSKITGIDASKVVNAPTLKEYWSEIKELLENNVIVGHNIIYDLSVLSKSLHRYDIIVEDFRYCCTLELSRRFIQTESYKLESLTKLTGYDYMPHMALDDALAAEHLFEYLKENYDVENSIHSYSTESKTNDKLDERLISNLHSLNGIIQGIVADEKVNEFEINRLKVWIEENLLYKQYTLFDKIITELSVILEDNIIDQYEQRKLKCLVSEFSSSKMYSETTLGIQVLQGIIDGISCDKEIDLEEIISLKKWLNEHDYLGGVYPYDKIVKIVKDALEDGLLDENEKRDLLKTFLEITNPLEARGLEEDKFVVNGKTFCLTGEFSCVSKSEISKKLQEKGAIEKNSVSSKVDFLFVGGMGSEAWKFGKIGGKIAKALELQEKGSKIQIIAEDVMKKIL